MSAVAMPVSGRRNARPELRSVPTGPGARGSRAGAAGAVVGVVPGSGLYVDGSLAGVIEPRGRRGESGVVGRSGLPVRPELPVLPGLHAGRHLAVAPTVSRPPLRLTQRGRLTRTLVCFGVLCLLVSLAFARLTAPGPLVADHATAVRPGQTLTDIARAELPAYPEEKGVEMLQELNRMNSTVIVAGQSLLVPAS